MVLAVANRIQETSTTSGTITLELLGAVLGFRTFVAGIGTTNECYYTIQDRITGDWEVGRGTVTDASPDTLSRDTVLANSLGTTALISFATNIKEVFVDQPAEQCLFSSFLEVGVPGVRASEVGSISFGQANGLMHLTPSNSRLRLQKAVDSTSGVDWFSRRSRGTIATATALLDADNIANMTGNYYTGFEFGNACLIRYVADGAPASGSSPGRIEFLTCPTGALNVLLRWSITRDGHFRTNTDNVNDIGASGGNRPRTIYVGTSIELGSAGSIRSGSGTPEGAVTAAIGSLFMRTDGGANTTLYVKESGAGNTGWVAK